MFKGFRAPFLSLSLKRMSSYVLQNFTLKPDFDDRNGYGYEGKDDGECSHCNQLSNVVNVSKDIRKIVVYLEPELEIRLH